MAEKPGELRNTDPSTVAAIGAVRESRIEKHAHDHPDSESLVKASGETGDTHEDTEQIKAQIEETRSNLGDTIDAIQDRLSFSNISEQVSETVNHAIETAKDNVYEATIGKAVDFMKNTGNEISQSSLVTTARENPIPFLLIGVGAGLLAYQSYSKKQAVSGRGYRTDLRKPGAADYDSSAAYNDRQAHARESASSTLDSAKDKIGGVKDSISSAAGTAYDGVAGVAGSTYSGAADLASSAYEKAGDFGTKAQETYNQYLEEKPWAIGAVALIAGAAVGLAIPSTRYEGELMGEARVNLMTKAQDTAGDLVDKAKQVATDAGKAISDDVKTAAQDVMNS